MLLLAILQCKNYELVVWAPKGGLVVVKPLTTSKQLMDAIEQLQRQSKEGWVYVQKGTMEMGEYHVKQLLKKHVDWRQWQCPKAKRYMDGTTWGGHGEGRACMA